MKDTWVSLLGQLFTVLMPWRKEAVKSNHSQATIVKVSFEELIIRTILFKSGG